MNSVIIRILIAIQLLIVGVSANAEATYHWKLKSIDKNTSEPISGVQFDFVFFDKKENNKKTQDQCVTDLNGSCDVKSVVSSSVFTGSSVEADFSVKKDGYSTTYTFDTEKIDTYHRILTVKLISASNGKLSPIKNWSLNDGPLLDSYISKKPIPISELTQSNSTNLPERGKFESDEQYRARKESALSVVISAPIPVHHEKICPTSYDHKTGIYSVRACLVFSDKGYLSIKSENGSSFTLANAFDSRQIRKKLINTYSMVNSSGFIWSADFKISPQEAEILEADLMSAIEVQSIKFTSTCSICESRKTEDALSSVITSAGALTGKSVANLNGWKDEAFKSGVVEEGWDYTVEPKNIYKYYIYRKSDQRVIFEMLVN
jgi:hypothetical protein